MLCVCFAVPVNTGQTTFEAIAQIVKRVKQTVEHKNDQHGRNSLLSSYIEFSCSLPHSEEAHHCELLRVL